METISLIYINGDEGRIDIIAYDSPDTAWRTARQLEIDLRSQVIELCHDYKLIAMYEGHDHDLHRKATAIIYDRLKYALQVIKDKSVHDDLCRTCANLVSRNSAEIIADANCYEINEELSFNTIVVHSV